MTVFVSYARRDNDITILQYIENLLSKQPGRIQRMLTYQARPFLNELFSSLAKPYIDDLHHHRFNTTRHAAVEAALANATSFLAVESAMYRRTPWTAKEFDYASRKKIRIFTLSTDRRTIDLCAPEQNPNFNMLAELYAPELV